MNGKLDPHIVKLFKDRFKSNCIKLLLESYEVLYSETGLKELSENNITVKLVGLMKKNPERNILNISINREAYNDTIDSYEGITDANESARIDIKYSIWSTNFEYEYFMEAKNLAENDWIKSTTGAKVIAQKLCRRYIEKGIENFTTANYPNGCLLGYVLEGNAESIVSKINSLLIKDKRSEEILLKQRSEKGISYLSKHEGTAVDSLQHFFLYFN